MNAMKKIVAVVGANASGKSGLSVRLAERFSGEIVSADSRQVFKGLDLGSGKITPEEMRSVRHHLLDVAEPNQFFSMKDYQTLAYAVIDDILARGRLPFLVGGTGLYVACITEGYVLSDIAPDLGYRRALEALTTEELAEKLRSARPDVQIDFKNRNRVMRLLEKIHDGDEEALPRKKRYQCLKLGVRWTPDALRARIDERLDRRLRDGMIDEVVRLRQNGATDEFLMKLGLEYRFIVRYLNGGFSDLNEMKSLLSTAIKQFAKRQRIWFRRDEEICWLDMAGDEDPYEKACGRIEAFLHERPDECEGA